MATAADTFSLSGRTAIVTGSAGRLGARFSEVLAAAGANTVLVDVQRRRNDALARDLADRYGTDPLAVHCDITEQDRVKDMVRQAEEKYGRVDVLINNAHYVPRDHPYRDAPFEEYPFDLWNDTVAMNHKGLFLCTKEAGKAMLRNGSGSVINIASTYGIVGPDWRIYGKSRLNSPAYYSYTKGGVVNFTRYMAAHWHRRNIRVNTLTPGGVFDESRHDDEFVRKYSEKTMLGRMAYEDDYDGAILFLASDASRYMTGANLVVDGGWSAW